MLPPTLDELLPLDHPARFVAEFVDALGRDGWSELGVEIGGDPLGAPAYHPRALLSVWLYGFMTGVRSCRKLEAACRDQISYLWLTGWQNPDHNTLWRFYKGHRQAMRTLFERTVRTAVTMKLGVGLGEHVVAVDLLEYLLRNPFGNPVAPSALQEPPPVLGDEVLAVVSGEGPPDLVGLGGGHPRHVHDELDHLLLPDDDAAAPLKSPPLQRIVVLPGDPAPVPLHELGHGAALTLPNGLQPADTTRIP